MEHVSVNFKGHNNKIYTKEFLTHHYNQIAKNLAQVRQTGKFLSADALLMLFQCYYHYILHILYPS